MAAFGKEPADGVELNVYRDRANGWRILLNCSLLALSVQNPACLGCIGDYTTQLYGDSHMPILGSL